MKARIGGQTTLDSLSPTMRDIVKKTTQEVVEKRWAEVQTDVARRFICAMALALNDIYGFGPIRISRVINAIDEIVTGYSDDSYTPAEMRNGTTDIKRMADRMEEELHRRKLFTPRKRRTENGDKNTRTR